MSSLEDIKCMLESHSESDAKQFTQIADELCEIKNNHLAHIERDIQEIKVTAAKDNKDLEWIKRFVIGALAASTASFVGSIFQLLIKK